MIGLAQPLAHLSHSSVNLQNEPGSGRSSGIYPRRFGLPLLTVAVRKSSLCGRLQADAVLFLQIAGNSVHRAFAIRDGEFAHSDVFNEARAGCFRPAVGDRPQSGHLDIERRA